MYRFPKNPLSSRIHTVRSSVEQCGHTGSTVSLISRVIMSLIIAAKTAEVNNKSLAG